MFDSLTFTNADKTAIQAIRADGTIKIIEPLEADLWALAVSGALGAVAPYVAPPVVVSPRDVDAERDRRIAYFPALDAVFQMGPASQQLVAAAGALAKFAVSEGAEAGDLRWSDPDHDFAWWDVDNVHHPMDAHLMSGFADLVMRWVTDHRRAARALKDMDPIPLDYQADSRWPE